MSKLDELIKEYCPEGVEYNELADIVDYIQPNKYIVNSTDYNNNYKTPVLTAGQTFILGYTNEEHGIYNANNETPTIIFDDFTTSFHWVDFNFKVKSSAMKILQIKEHAKMNFRFVYYAMKCIKYNTTEHSRQWISNYSNLKIPVPPIQVQEEIVRILDNFTNLTAELEAELESRKKQYEYYRKELFEFSEGVEYKNLGEIADFSQGLQVNIEEQFLIQKEKTIPFLRIVDFVKNDEIPRYIYKPNDRYIKKDNEMIMIRYGASAAGKVFLNKYGAIANNMFKVNFKIDNINIKYIYYYLSQTNIYNLLNNSGGKSTMPSVNFTFVSKIKIPIPPIEKQNRIVEILDKFDNLVNDITIEGLPAEIEKRKQQYKYYRNKILSFKEI